MAGNMQVEARANIVTLGAILVTAGISWGVVSGGLGSVKEELKSQKDASAVSEQRMREQLIGHEARIRAIEQSSARQDERLLLILDSVKKIEVKLDSKP